MMIVPQQKRFRRTRKMLEQIKGHPSSRRGLVANDKVKDGMRDEVVIDLAITSVTVALDGSDAERDERSEEGCEVSLLQMFNKVRHPAQAGSGGRNQTARCRAGSPPSRDDDFRLYNYDSHARWKILVIL